MVFQFHPRMKYKATLRCFHLTEIMKREGGSSIRKHMSISAINKISFQDHMIVYIYVVTRQACVWEVVRTMQCIHEHTQLKKLKPSKALIGYSSPNGWLLITNRRSQYTVNP